MRLIYILILALMASYFYAKAIERPEPRRIVVDLPEEITIATDKDSFNAVLVGDTLFITFKNKNQ